MAKASSPEVKCTFISGGSIHQKNPASHTQILEIQKVLHIAKNQTTMQTERPPMIDNQIYEKIINGETVRLETTSTEERIMSMKKWLQQFKPIVSVNVYPQQDEIRATLWIGGLQYDQRFLMAGTLKSDSLSFTVINGDTG